MAALTASLIALTAVSAASQFHAQRQAAKGVERMGRYEEQIYGMNAELAEWQAEDAIARGRESEQRHRQGVRGLIGTQRANMAAQGIDIGEGSAADIQAETAELGELDAMTIRNNARREAWGYKVQATQYRQQGLLARYGARNQAAGLRAQSWGTLLTGAAQIGSMGRR